MDKNNNRKQRMTSALQLAASGEIQIDSALRDEAADLALDAFDDPSDDHIDCIYLRLINNRAWGLGYAGAVTVH